MGILRAGCGGRTPDLLTWHLCWSGQRIGTGAVSEGGGTVRQGAGPPAPSFRGTRTPTYLYPAFFAHVQFISYFGSMDQASYIQSLETRSKELEELVESLTTALEEEREAGRQKDACIVRLQERIDVLLDEKFGPSRERHISPGIPIDEKQGWLFADEPMVPLLGKERTEKPRPARTSKPRGRYVLDRTPDEIKVLLPDGIQNDWRKVDTRVFRYYKSIPMQMILVEIRREVYRAADGTLHVAALPSEILGKASTGLVAHVVANKFVYHLSNERTREQLAHAGHAIPSSTLSDWIQRGAQKMLPLLQPLRARILAGQYIQADETTILVRDREKSQQCGKHHRGYYWVYSDPVAKLGLFDYQKGRSRDGPSAFLEGFQGDLQTDGYSVYIQFGRSDEITLHGCLAHARRRFRKAEKQGDPRATVVMDLMGQLYDVERELRQKSASFAEREHARQLRSVPILEQIKSFVEAHPGGSGHLWSKAVGYLLNQWDHLISFTTNGRVEIDNNLVENQIRPVALGRKNYLVAGSHEAARNAAILYSLVSICKQHGVKFAEWFEEVLQRIDKTPEDERHTLLPDSWKASREAKLAKAA